MLSPAMDRYPSPEPSEGEARSTPSATHREETSLRDSCDDENDPTASSSSSSSEDIFTVDSSELELRRSEPSSLAARKAGMSDTYLEEAETRVEREADDNEVHEVKSERPDTKAQLRLQTENTSTPDKSSATISAAANTNKRTRTWIPAVGDVVWATLPSTRSASLATLLRKHQPESLKSRNATAKENILTESEYFVAYLNDSTHGISLLSGLRCFDPHDPRVVAMLHRPINKLQSSAQRSKAQAVKEAIWFLEGKRSLVESHNFKQCIMCRYAADREFWSRMKIDQRELELAIDYDDGTDDSTSHNSRDPNDRQALTARQIKKRRRGTAIEDELPDISKELGGNIPAEINTTTSRVERSDFAAGNNLSNHYGSKDRDSDGSNTNGDLQRVATHEDAPFAVVAATVEITTDVNFSDGSADRRNRNKNRRRRRRSTTTIVSHFYSGAATLRDAERRIAKKNWDTAHRNVLRALARSRRTVRQTRAQRPTRKARLSSVDPSTSSVSSSLDEDAAAPAPSEDSDRTEEKQSKPAQTARQPLPTATADAQTLPMMRKCRTRTASSTAAPAIYHKASTLQHSSRHRRSFTTLASNEKTTRRVLRSSRRSSSPMRGDQPSFQGSRHREHRAHTEQMVSPDLVQQFHSRTHGNSDSSDDSAAAPPEAIALNTDNAGDTETKIQTPPHGSGEVEATINYSGSIEPPKQAEGASNNPTPEMEPQGNAAGAQAEASAVDVSGNETEELQPLATMSLQTPHGKPLDADTMESGSDVDSNSANFVPLDDNVDYLTTPRTLVVERGENLDDTPKPVERGLGRPSRSGLGTHSTERRNSGATIMLPTDLPLKVADTTEEEPIHKDDSRSGLANKAVQQS